MKFRDSNHTHPHTHFDAFFGIHCETLGDSAFLPPYNLPEKVLSSLDDANQKHADHAAGLRCGNRIRSPLGQLRALAPQKSGDGAGKRRVPNVTLTGAANNPLEISPVRRPGTPTTAAARPHPASCVFCLVPVTD